MAVIRESKMTFRNAFVVPKNQAGFTLIELMITVAIVAILTAVALPSYRSYIQRGDRASARAALLEAQQFMERYYAANDAYDQDKAAPPNPVALPLRLQTAPPEAPKYDIAVNAPNANSYTLTATPRNADDCGNLTLTNAGVKGRTGVALTVADCWK